MTDWVGWSLVSLRSQNREKDSSESEQESSILTGFRIHILYQEIKTLSRMANFTQLCDNACFQPPTGERGEATKRDVLFVATDCGGEQARLWEDERARTPFQLPRACTRQPGSDPNWHLF